MSRHEATLKWAETGALFLGLTVLAACAETGGMGLGTGVPRDAATAPAKPKRTGPAPTEAALMGKQGSDIENLLGAPTLLRREDGAQVWQYAGERCVLLLYLYQQTDSAYRVSYLEARPRPGGASDVAACLSATYFTS